MYMTFTKNFCSLNEGNLKDLNKWEDKLCQELKSIVTISLHDPPPAFIIYFNSHNLIGDGLGVTALNF